MSMFLANSYDVMRHGSLFYVKVSASVYFCNSWKSNFLYIKCQLVWFDETLIATPVAIFQIAL